jgi:hypothetical protein
MEPRPEGRGDRTWRGRPPTAGGRFNGATTRRSWRRRMPRKRRSSSRCFNGATTRRSWRRRPSNSTVRIISHASMEPRPEGRGDDGACAITGERIELQWSHDPKVVETRHGWPETRWFWPASMEPRPEGRGDGPLPTCTRGTPLSFNGATTRRSWRRDTFRNHRMREGFASMEPRPEGRGDTSAITTITTTRMLQWSHDPKVVETDDVLRQRRTRRIASMEPRPEGRGDTFNETFSVAAHNASMEPRPEGRGDRAALLLLGPPSLASMEPRPEGRGDRRPSFPRWYRAVFERPLLATPKAESREPTVQPVAGPCMTEDRWIPLPARACGRGCYHPAPRWTPAT